jgi:hypothetical protein
MSPVSTAIGVLLALSLVGCTSNKTEEPSKSDDYQNCLQTEAAKFLDETGSNADYANEKAMEICK